MLSDDLTVIKVGGSLFDWPDLIPTLNDFLTSFRRPILVPGGGAAADIVREIDQTHGLSADAAHWLALGAMEFNGHWLDTLVNVSSPTSVVMPYDLSACRREWDAGRVPVIDSWAFCRGDLGRPGALPHDWSVTSDSIAVRIAECLGARQVWLLKSTDAVSGMSVREAAFHGLIDPMVPVISERAERAGTPLFVRLVNLRSWTSEAAEGILQV